MNCPKCNREVNEDASYCGACGAALFQEDIRYTIFNYHAKFARENGASASLGSIFGNAMLMMVPAIAAAVVCPLMGEQMWLWLGIPLGGAIVSLAGVIGMTVAKAPYFNAPQQAIVLDNEKQMHYLVRFHGDQLHGWDTASRMAAALYNDGVRQEDSRRAQADAFVVQLITDYQEGKHQPSSVRRFFVGSELSVIELNQPKVLKKTRKGTTYAYTDKNGRKKKVLIPNAYPNFKI